MWICIQSVIYTSSQTPSGLTTRWLSTANGASKRRSDYNQLIYDQSVLGMDYLDCSNQTLSLIDFKLKDHTGEVVNLHGGHVSFSIIFVKVVDEW